MAEKRNDFGYVSQIGIFVILKIMTETLLIQDQSWKI